MSTKVFCDRWNAELTTKNRFRGHFDKYTAEDQYLEGFIEMDLCGMCVSDFRQPLKKPQGKTK